MHSYPCGITREEFEIIRPDLERARKTAKPRKIDLYDVFCGLLYLLKSGCQWRMIPADFPKWNTIYFYYGIWSEKKGSAQSVLDKAFKKSVSMLRNQELRRDKTSFCIIDAQSVQNADTAEKKGYDAGKKTSGGHIAADADGLPHAVCVTAADVSDRNGAAEMIKINRDSLSEVRKFLCDGGYSGENFADSVREINGASVEAVKRNEPHKFVVLPKRQVVGRSFGWLDKARRLWKNCERKPNTSLQMAVLAFIAVMLRRF